MTVLVGVLCSDGLVVGADSIATSSAGMHPLIQVRSDDKIKIIGGRVIIAGTGAVGLGQRFHAVVQKAWDEEIFSRKSCNDCCRHLATAAVTDFRGTGTPQHSQNGYGFAAMLGVPIGNSPELVEFGLPDFQPERKTGNMHFVSMGSGQVLADPFLAFVSRVLWQGKQPDVKTATFGVYWALDHAIKFAPGGIGAPIRIAVLRRVSNEWSARLLEEAELEEQAQHISEIESRISGYPAQIIAQGEVSPPPQPPPPSKSA